MLQFKRGRRASRIVLLFVVNMVGAAGLLSAQTTWTGAVSTAWNTAGNWTAGVPIETSDVTIPNVTNDPVISVAGAVAKSLVLQTGGLLTVQAAGTLTLNGAAGVCFLNQGTVQNSGIITLGNTTALASYGLRNEGAFNNNAGGQLRIDRVGPAFSAVYCVAGSLTNAGTVAIGANASSGVYGVELFGGNFNNQPGGVVGIDRITSQSLRTQNGTFNNQGTVNIGMLNTGTTATYGMVISISGPFNNLAGGQVNISRAITGIYVFSNAFNNAGIVRIGSAGGVSELISSQGSDFFYNNPGGIFYASGTVAAARFVNAGGTIAPGYSPGQLSFNASEDFANSTMAMEVNGKTTAGSDYDRVNVSGTVKLGGTLALSIGYAPANDDQITILSGNIIAGTFTTVTGLPANWYVNYLVNAVVLSYGSPLPVNTWTGAAGTQWTNAANWSGGVPVAGSVVEIPDVANDPVISSAGALAQSVKVQAGAVLTISAAGSLAVNGSAYYGIWNRGTVLNSGLLQVGNSASTGSFGIFNEGAFTNASGGQVFIDRASGAGIMLQSNSFSNSGAITIGAQQAIANLISADEGNFTHSTGGLLKGTGNIQAANFTNAGGTLAPGYSPGKMTFTASENFASSAMNLEINGIAVAGTQFDQVVVSGTATLGGTLNLAINHAASPGDQVVIVSASAVTGTFSNVTGLSTKWNVVYYPNIVVLVYGIPQTTWTGAVSTAWNTAGNWTAGVPDEASDVTIPNVTNDPVISVAGTVAKSLVLQTGGLLTVQAAGTLTLNGAAGVCFLNQGTVQNSGIITLGNTTALASYGLRNEGAFNNNAGGQLRIDRVGPAFSAVYCVAGSLTNAGTVAIGANASSGVYGVELFGGNFNNQPGGVVGIDRITSHSLRTQNGTFNNQGTVNIGMLNTGTTANYGMVISISGPFNNLAGGQVNISRAITGIYVFSNAFNNAGIVRIGSAGGVSELISSQGSDFFYNNPGGIFYASGTVAAARFVNAGGTIAPGYSPGQLSFDASEDFANSTMAMEVNGKTTAGSDYDRVNVSGTATLGGTLALSIGYAPANGDQVTLVSASAISGTFSQVTGLAQNWKVTYAASSVMLSYDPTNTWTGAISSDWNTAGNWSTGAVPNAAQNVIIQNVVNGAVINALNTSVNTVLVQPGATLTINANSSLTITGFQMFNNTKAGLLNQGTVNNKGTLKVN